MVKYLKIKKNWNQVVSKPEHHNLKRKTAIKTTFEFSREKEHSLIADTKLQVDQIKRKMEAKFNKPFFIGISNILQVKTTISFQAINQINYFWAN